MTSGICPRPCKSQQLSKWLVAAAYAGRSLGIALHRPFEARGRFLLGHSTAVSLLDQLLYHNVLVNTTSLGVTGDFRQAFRSLRRWLTYREHHAVTLTLTGRPVSLQSAPCLAWLTLPCPTPRSASRSGYSTIAGSLLWTVRDHPATVTFKAR
jgi:hypothetical protein